MSRTDLPLDLVVLADLGLPAGQVPHPRVRRVEPAELNALYAALAPEVTVPTPAGPLTLTFTEPRGFRPETVAARVPETAALLELRRRLSQQGIAARELEGLVAGLPEASPLKRALRDVMSASAAPPAAAAPVPTAAPTPAPAPRPAGDDPLDALFSMVDTGGAPAAPDAPRPMTAERRAFEALVRELTAGGRGGGVVKSATQRGLAAAVDSAIADTLRPVLHDPGFAALEQSWSGLRFLLRRIDHRAGIQVFVIPTTRGKLERDAREVLVPFATDRRREGRTVVAVADFDLGADPAGVSPLAEVASAQAVPLLAGLDPALLGLASFADLSTIDDLGKALEAAAGGAWTTLRGDDRGRWLFLAANRFLLRLPYGAEHDRVKEFAFEENAAGAPSFHLWGRAVWVLAERVAASFARCGWGVELLGQADEVPAGDLPVRMLALPTGEEVPVALEALVNERRAQELAQSGVVAFLCRRDGDQAFLAAAPCVAGGVSTKTGAEARRESLPFALMVAQVSAGVARLLDSGLGGADVLAPALARLTATREGPVLEVHAAGDSLSVSPYRDPLRGLPPFSVPLSPAR